jgi:transcriptional regulator with XRE-family HTH domain
MTLSSSPSTEPQFGRLLQGWRRTRGKSQLELAIDAHVSPRHVSFIETGRSVPSREMVLALAEALEVPLRERNALLLAAGYAPVYREAPLDAPELEAVRQALALILDHQEPYPAVVLNRHWDLLHANGAARDLLGFMAGDGPPPPAAPPLNVVRQMLRPGGLRSHVTNWEQVAETLVQRVHREALGGVADERTRALLAEVTSYPGVPARWGAFDPSVPLSPLVPICFAKDDVSASYFSTVTTIGTAQDVTLQELRVECFFPADSATRDSARALRERLRRRAASPRGEA